MRLQTKCRRVGTSGSPSPTNALCGYSERGRDVRFLQSKNCAVPYKRDRIVFLFCPTMVIIVDLFLRRANAVRPYRCVAVVLSDQYSIFKLRSGCDIGYYALGCVYTKYRNAHPRFDTSSLQPVPESLIVFTKSQGLYVPASIKTLSTYPRKSPLLLHKKCNNCRNVAKLKDKSFVCTIC